MNGPSEPRWTLANLLTAYRFPAAAAMMVFALLGYGNMFLAVLASAFATDVLDGMAARALNQVSRFGSVLDSWADMFLYMAIAAGCWLLWPDVVSREAPFVGMIVGSYLLPAGVGLIRFGTFTSYHTWTVKVAAATTGISVFTLFLFDVAWLFQVAAVLCVIAAIEEIAITMVIPELHSNVRSLWTVYRRYIKPRRSSS